MSALVRTARLALTAVALLLPVAAQAQPLRIQVHEPFYEEGRFALRNLQLQGRGPSIDLPRGGRLDATIDFAQDCSSCGASSNQIIIGVAGDPNAQACIYSGPGRMAGWQNARFTLSVPDGPGVYEIRARYAQARSCADAMKWWRTDRPNGPGPDSTIGVVVVGDPPPPVDAPRRARREIREIQRDIDDRLATLDDLQAQTLDLSKRPANGKRLRQIRDLTVRAMEITNELYDLQEDLSDHLFPDGRGRPDRVVRPGRPGRPGRPVVVRPEIIIVNPPAPGPQPLSQHEHRELLQTIDRAAFSDAQMNAIRDAIHAGAFFLTNQAVDIVKEFAHESDKVEAAALVCTRVIEHGALPRLLGTFVFESYKQELRERTGNQCGWVP